MSWNQVAHILDPKMPLYRRFRNIANLRPDTDCPAGKPKRQCGRQTGHNSQTVAWKIYTRPEDVQTMAAHVVDWMRKLVEAGEPMAVKMNMAIICDLFDKGMDMVTREAPHLAFTHAHQEDRFAPHACDIAMTYVELYAPVLGLGTCWAGFFERAAEFWPPLQDFLSLPEGHRVMSAAMVGYPKVKYYRCPERTPLQVRWV